MAFESVWFGRLGLERQTTLSSAGSAVLCDVGAAADSYGVLVMSSLQSRSKVELYLVKFGT